MDDIIKYSRESFSNCNGSHGWGHTLRVYNLSLHIGKIEKADLKVLQIATYLHDVGRRIQDESRGTICHAKKGAEIASEILKTFPISEDQKSNIIHSILSHRFRGKNRPETIEAKVLFDSDKLDAVGAIGIGRAFQFAGEVGARLHNPSVDPNDTLEYSREDTAYREYRLKLSKIRDRMLTKEGKRIADGRHEFMKSFFNRFLQEYRGKL
jgi:uncharacterized protein